VEVRLIADDGGTRVKPGHGTRQPASDPGTSVARPTTSPGSGLPVRAFTFSPGCGRRPIMNEVRFAVGDADAGPQERLGKEISAYNAAVTGTMRGRMLSVAVRRMTVTCALGSTGGHGAVRLHRPHAGLPARLRRHPTSELTMKCVTRIPSLGGGNSTVASAPSSGVPRRCRRTGRLGFVPRARPPRRGLVRRRCSSRRAGFPPRRRGPR
jgi:hypothetical protein